MQEVAEVVRTLVIRGVVPFEVTDICAAITESADDMPSHADGERVKQLLRARGWPISDPADPQHL